MIKIQFFYEKNRNGEKIHFAQTICMNRLSENFSCKEVYTFLGFLRYYTSQM